MKNPLLLALFICLCISSVAQQGSSLVSPFEGTSGRLRILPPNVAKTQEFGNVPINFSTGQLNFNMPLYEIKVDENLTIPIQLAYNNTGLKPQDVPTWVGNGWNLDVGGTIVQTVNGISDFTTNGLKDPVIRQEMQNYLNGTVPEPTRYEYLTDVLNSQKDSQYDLFSFNFLGRSGKFYFHGDNIVMMNTMPLKITYASNAFTITDEKGYQFAFAINKPNTGSFSDGYINPTGSPFVLNSVTWYLTKITSPNGVEVNFNYYNDITYQTYAPGSSYATGVRSGNPCTIQGQFDVNVTYTNTSVGQYLLDNITWKGKMVDFQFFDRNDLVSISGAKAKGLSAIVAYDEANQETNRIGFNYGYLGTNDRLKLNSVSFIENKTPFAAVQTTSFEYYTAPGVGDIPIPSLMTPTITRDPNNSVDHWGYYNGRNNSTKVPVANYSQITSTYLTSFGTADRRADNTYSKIGMLKKINYPTKGYTEIFYEPNIVNYNNILDAPFFLRTQTPETPPPGGSGVYLQIGGNRISRIVDNTGASESNERIITYEQANLLAEPYYVTEIESGLISGPGLDAPCEYCGKRYFVSDNNVYNWDGYQIEYRKVTETYGSTGGNGKKIYEYDTNAFVGGPVSAPPHAATVNITWRSGNLLKEQTYEKNSLTPAKELINTYNTSTIYPISRTGFKAGRVRDCVQETRSSLHSYNYFTHTPTPVFTDYYNLKAATTTDYSGGVGLSKTVTYTYTPEVLLRTTSIIDSKNKKDSTINYYANDFNNITGTNIDQLKTKNIIGMPLKVVRYVNNLTVDGVMVKSDANGNPLEIYRYENASLVNLPHSMSQFIIPEFKLFESRKYSSKGNPIEIKRLNQPPTTYVWGYKHSYPIASVQNATVANVEGVIGSLETVADNYTDVNVENIGTNLRSNLPAAMVTSGVMKSGAGLSKITAPNGLKSTFEYDGVNRLSSIKDHLGNLTDYYRYFYATASECTPPSPPVISITSTTLCSVTLSATTCSGGTVQWSNGASGLTTSVPTTTSISYTAKCKVGTCESVASNALTVPVLPATWSAMDVGTPSSPGCTQNAAGNLTMLGYGPASGTSDNFHWIYKAFSGNVTIIAKINSIPADDGDRSGIMIRSNLNPNAQYYILLQDGNANVGELKRDVNGGTGGLYSFAPSAVNQTWIKVVKTGTSIKGYYSTNSNPEANNAWNDYFNLTGSNPTTLDFGSNFYIGFALWGGANQTTFSNITINGVAF